jgi:hypothetical protein
VPKNRRQGFNNWKGREVTHDYNNSFYFDENDEKQFWQGYDAFPQTDSAISYIRRMKEDPFLLFLSWGPSVRHEACVYICLIKYLMDEKAIQPNFPFRLKYP